MENQSHGKLMFLSINNFFKEYLNSVNNDLGDNFAILVISKDIIADESTTEWGTSRYKSRYEDIEFATELFPNPNVMEYRLSATMESFADRYKNQLDQIDNMKLLCCIVDMVVNDGTDVYLIASHTEMKVGFFDIMKEVFFDKFNLIMTDYTEAVETPELMADIGKVDEIKMMLDFQINHLKLIDEDIGIFFNRLTKDMATEYREILMNKSIDELYAIGTKQHLHINRHKPKEYIVDHILKKLLEEEELLFH